MLTAIHPVTRKDAIQLAVKSPLHELLAAAKEPSSPFRKKSSSRSRLFAATTAATAPSAKTPASLALIS